MRSFSILAAALAVAAAVALWWGAGWRSPLGVWLAAVNVAALLAYGYDKAVAGRGPTRVPEVVLLGLAALGGSPAALGGMALFRHKTAKATFRRRFWVVVALQVVAAAALCAWRWDLVSRAL